MEEFSQKGTKSNRKYVNILDVRVDSTSEREVLAKITQKIASKAKFYVVTPNPEIIVRAQKDSELREILNKADLALPDGSGLKIAEPNLTIVRGRDVFVSLLKEASMRKWKVFLLGGTRDANQRAIKKAKLFYNSINIKGEAGATFDLNGAPVSEVDTKIQSDSLDKISIMQPDILFVGLGAPKQEKWIYKNFEKLEARCVMAVGGAIDYFAGTAKLPPVWIEKLGLEWLWRLINEPWRFARIISAVVIFPLKVIKSKLTGT